MEDAIEIARRVLRDARSWHLAARDPEIMAEYAVQVAWRLIRELGRTTGFLSTDELLCVTPVARLLMPVPAVTTAPDSLHSTTALKVCQTSTPPPPLHPLGLRTTPGASDAWGAAMSGIVEFLDISNSPVVPYLLEGPRWWPSPADLCEYEATLLDYTLGLLVDSGNSHALSVLTQPHDLFHIPLRRFEAANLLRLTLQEAYNRQYAEVEEHRAVVSIRLEDLIQRSRQAMDMRVELGAIKQLATVQGVTRSEPEDAQSEFARVVRRVANEAPTPPQLPPSR